VDFDSTTFDSVLRAGDSGVMNLVVKNTGGYKADNVQILLPSTGQVHLDKRFYAGQVDPSVSKTFPVIVRIDPAAKSGLSAVQVQISYDGFNSDGTADDNQIITWEIPFRIYGKPLFQITPLKTTYFKDNLEDLILEGVAMDSVKDLEITLSSSCVTVIGSSRQFIGSISSNQPFNLTYQIKPSSADACMASLRLSYTDGSGNTAQDNISLGLNVEEAGVDFKVVNITYNPTGPGENTKVKVSIKNVGNAKADDVTVALSLSSPFAPLDSQEKYIGEIGGGESVDTDFNIAVGWDASAPQTYSLPMTVSYKVGGSSYTIDKEIGLDVSGKIVLQIINVASSRGSVQVDVANIGTTTANGVKATLTLLGNSGGATAGDTTSNAGGVGSGSRRVGADNASQGGGGFGGNRSRGNFTQFSQSGQSFISYKSDIKPSKQTTFTFATSATGQAIITLEYNGLKNERVTQTERITLSGSSSSGVSGSNSSSGTRGSSGTSLTTYALYVLGVIVVAFVAYKLYKRRKNKSVAAAGKKESK